MLSRGLLVRSLTSPSTAPLINEDPFFVIYFLFIFPCCPPHDWTFCLLHAYRAVPCRACPSYPISSQTTMLQISSRPDRSNAMPNVLPLLEQNRKFDILTSSHPSFHHNHNHVFIVLCLPFIGMIRSNLPAPYTS